LVINRDGTIAGFQRQSPTRPLRRGPLLTGLRAPGIPDGRADLRRLDLP
jgi:hypothetical protein